MTSNSRAVSSAAGRDIGAASFPLGDVCLAKFGFPNIAADGKESRARFALLRMDDIPGTIGSCPRPPPNYVRSAETAKVSRDLQHALKLPRYNVYGRHLKSNVERRPSHEASPVGRRVSALPGK